jgi:hypothetical protein
MKIIAEDSSVYSYINSDGFCSISSFEPELGPEM